MHDTDYTFDPKAPLRQNGTTRRWNKDDLPLPLDEHKRFRKEIISKVIAWVGEQETIFNTTAIGFRDALQRIWDEVFPGHPTVIVVRDAVYDITLQKIYEYRSGVGNEGINNVVDYFTNIRQDLTTDEMRAQHVQEAPIPLRTSEWLLILNPAR
ncbi:hypothetical protein NM688_g9325 [Phlebia brevispora]|uniref:Uncharacterized protein n=1 Tax=Phlebia brevispora TaxID=194682 RepID=A0ACC1RGW7_9APHY|nr:hypothetical protein NM688_g9325 [Phlebia brevispora]